MLPDRSEVAPPEAVNHPCFICGSEESDIRFRPDLQRWGRAGPFILRRCHACGLVFNSPRLPPEELTRLYHEDYYFFARPAGAEFARICGAYLRTIAHLPKLRVPRLLEVGSAKGYMLALLARLGWTVTGIEISDYAAAYSRRTFGVEVFTGTLEAFRETDGRSFNAVLAQDVLEHVPDPGAFLAGLRDSVEPGGWLVIDTPNVGGRNVRVLAERWRGFNPFHVYLFDRAALTQAIAKVGFDVHLIGSYNNVPPEASVAAGVDHAPTSSGIAELVAATVRSGLTAVRRGLDRGLLRYHLRRAERIVRSSPPTLLDSGCQGDNLVCIAVRRA
jgi:2-polyprenyl-3-methyl-5-hydroxy-6-metoxy-1,4-benzoquinol methylase